MARYLAHESDSYLLHMLGLYAALERSAAILDDAAILPDPMRVCFGQFTAEAVRRDLPLPVPSGRAPSSAYR